MNAKPFTAAVIARALRAHRLQALSAAEVARREAPAEVARREALKNLDRSITR